VESGFSRILALTPEPDADGWITRATHVVTAGETLQNVLDSLGAQILAANAASASDYSVTVSTDDGDATNPADDGTRLVTIERMGAFTLTLAIAPAVAGTQSAAQAAITNDQASFAFDYVTGSNREVLVPDSLDVTVADNDAPGVLIHREAGGYAARRDGAPYDPTEKFRSLLAAPDADAWQRADAFLKG